MAANPKKKVEAEKSALSIAQRLAALKPEKVSERQWTKDAGVSPSFFSNLRGTPTKPPSDPSVYNLREVLRVRGLTLAEFFVPEAQGRLARRPSQQDIERALIEALEELPAKRDARAAYLAEVVQGLLALPADLPTTEAEAANSEPGDLGEAALPRAATTQK